MQGERFIVEIQGAGGYFTAVTSPISEQRATTRALRTYRSNGARREVRVVQSVTGRAIHTIAPAV